MPSAAILAGGQATRFGGRDKSALIVGGRSILERQCDELSQVVDEILIVLAANQHPTPELKGGPTFPIPGAWRTSHGEVPIRFVVDRVPECGPLAGLDAALGAAAHDPLIVVACDMPMVSAGFVQHLLSLANAADAVVPRTEDGYHPLCAVYTRACQPVISRHLGERRLSMMELLKAVRLREVPEHEIARFGDPERLLANVNTPTALDNIDQLQSHET